MRLGIDYRLLASPENLVNRGIGRYTQLQLRHVLELDVENEYLLLCPPGSDRSLVLPQIRDAANVTVCEGPAPVGAAPHDPYDRRGLLRRAAAYQDWIHGLGVDLYHATAPFVLDQTTPLAFDACPMVATVYDFIPLVFPAAYLTTDEHRAAYAGAARMVATASRLIAISDGTRDDAAAYLGFPRHAIDRAWPFADAGFRPLGEEVVGATLRRLEARAGLPSRFVLTVTALHHSKNLDLLLAAYARLTPSFRRALPLVVSCHLHEGAEDHLRRMGAAHGIGDDLVLTDYVSDAELAALYNRATVVVHPSRYEGFGLPAVEAMQCGAPVITTTAPSLPEVTAGAAELVDPDDPVALAAAIEGLYEDPDRRRHMGKAGIERAGAFTPGALARDTLASYRRALDSGSEPRPAGAGTRLRIAACTPCPPAPGDAAEWAPALLGVLAELGDVEVFTEDEHGAVPEAVADRFRTYHRSALRRRHGHHPFDLVVGNGLDCGDVAPALLVGRDVPAPVGGGDPWDGRPALAAAVARARLEWPGDRLVALVVGEGIDTRRLAEGVEGRVEVVTGAPDDDARLAACDIVVCAGGPRTVVRALAAGKPVLLRGAPAGTGWPAEEPADLAGRLVELAGDREELRRRSAAARAWFEKEAGPDVVASAYRRAVGSVVGRGLADGVAGSERPDREAVVEELGSDARVLCLGAGAADAAFALSLRAGEVVAGGPWLDDRGPAWWRAMVVDPGLAARGPFDLERLGVRVVELPHLVFPDASFDAVVSGRATDGLSADGLGRALTEMARVLRPGGLVVMSATVRLYGPAGAPGVAPEVLRGHIAAAGLDAVTDHEPRSTAAGRRRLAGAFDPARRPPASDTPTVWNGALLGALELVLRKPGGQRPG